MNCRDAEYLILTERDGALDESQRAALVTHLAGCARCRQMHTSLAEAVDAWRVAGAKVQAPDPGVEWEAVRRQIRADTGAVSTRTGRRTTITWLGIPLAAAAALALFFAAGSSWFGGRGTAITSEPQLARAEFVELTGEAASAVVYVDQESGWLVVWAVEGEARGGI